MGFRGNVEKTVISRCEEEEEGFFSARADMMLRVKRSSMDRNEESGFFFGVGARDCEFQSLALVQGTG